MREAVWLHPGHGAERVVRFQQISIDEKIADIVMENTSLVKKEG